MAQLFLSTLSGTTAVLHDQHTVGDVQRSAAALHPSLRADELRLSHGTRALDAVPAATLLSELGIAGNATIFSAARLLGGGKKRKKKTYTKPKKIKHKHKTVKMAVLKYYKIAADGTIERLRKECPENTCGAGVFMASHADRVYCGKCGLTYVKS